MSEATTNDGAPFVRADVRAFLDFLNAQPGPKMHEMSAADARTMFRMMRPIADEDARPLAVVRDLSCPGPAGDIPLRLYDARDHRGPGPVMVFFHGGGFVIGDLDTHEPFCARMAEMLDVPVVAVDYRLAPEHPWPAAPEDCEAATRWTASSPAELGRPATALYLSGDSAGGNLAIVTAMALRDNPAPVAVAAQLAIYPAADMANEHPSFNDFAEGYLLTREGMQWFGEAYAPDPAHRHTSPALHSQKGMPPTVVVTAGLDPIRDQGRAYAARLAQDGVTHIFREAAGSIHGFVQLRKAIPSTAADIDGMILALKSLADEAAGAAA